MAHNEVKLALLPKQKKFVLAQAKECLYSGAFGAGKSYSLCVKAVLRASKPGAREALVRKTLQDLKATTLRTLLQGDGETPPVLPLGSYEHNKSERVIRLLGGGEIVYFSMEDSSTIGSYNLTGAGVDQAEELTEDDWYFLMGRLRATGKGLTRQLYGVCNPDSPSHHLARRFGLAPDVLEPQPGCWVVTTKSTDNPHLPADYIKVLLSFTGVRKKRFVDGIWAGSEGVVYETWDRSKHVQRFAYSPDEVTRVLIGVDDGTSVPFAAIRAVKLRSGRKYIERMEYGRGLLAADKVRMVAGLGPADAVFVDPAASGLKLELRAAGLPVYDADNEVLAGIQEVQNQLAIAPDGLPWLVVSPDCGEIIREMETYEWKKSKGVQSNETSKDEPVKENDHAADALRYLCMGDKLPPSAAVDTKAVSKMGEQMIEERKPRFVGYLEPRMGWGAESDTLIRKGDRGLMEFLIDHEQPDVGPWRLWCDLPDDRPDQTRPWVVAASVGTGAPGSMSVIKVGDAESRRVLAECVMPNASPEQVAREAIAAGIWFGGKEGHARLIYNHVGGGVVAGETIRQLQYRNLYRHVEEGIAGEDAGWRYSPAGAVALLGNLQSEVKAGKYHEATAATLADLQRWGFTTEGTVAPVSQATEGEAAKNASDRALCAMLLAHAFRWVERLKPTAPKPAVGSVQWLEEREKGTRRGQRAMRR